MALNFENEPLLSSVSSQTHRPIWLTLEKTSKWTSLMLSSESEYRHSSVNCSPSRTGWVGPLMSKVAACGQRLHMQVIDHNMNRQGAR